jgi:hypothetical protein
MNAASVDDIILRAHCPRSKALRLINPDENRRIQFVGYPTLQFVGHPTHCEHAGTRLPQKR